MLKDASATKSYTVFCPIYPPVNDDLRVATSPRQLDAPKSSRKASKVMGRVATAVGAGAALMAVSRAPTAKAQLFGQPLPINLLHQLAYTLRADMNNAFWWNGCLNACYMAESQYRIWCGSFAVSTGTVAKYVGRQDLATALGFTIGVACDRAKEELYRECRARGCY